MLHTTVREIAAEAGVNVFQYPEERQEEILLAEISRHGTAIFNVDPADDGETRRSLGALGRAARAYINTSRSKATAFWNLYEAIYGGHLEQDAWTGEVFYKGMPVDPYGQKLVLGKHLGAIDAISTNLFTESLEVLLNQHAYSPVERYLDTLPLPEEGDWLVYKNLAKTIFGVEDELSQTLLEKWLMSAVARVYEPGCPIRGCLTIRGAQETGKSSFFRVLGGSWYMSFVPMGDDMKEAERKFQTSWIAEVEELENVSGKRSLSEIRRVLTANEDDYRDLFARRPKKRPRHLVFSATANSGQIFNDPQGSTRYWLIDSGDHKIPLAWVKEYRDVIWACAKESYMSAKQGIESRNDDERLPWVLASAESKESEGRNGLYKVDNTWADEVELQIKKATQDGAYEVAFKISDMYRSLDLKPNAVTLTIRGSIRDALDSLGYTSVNQRVRGYDQPVNVLRKGGPAPLVSFENGAWTIPYSTKELAELRRQPKE